MRWDRRDGLIVAALVAAAFAFYWPLFAPGGARAYFVDGDFVDQFYAFARFEASELAAARLPLWNPFAYAGSPFWADVQAAVAYPPGLAVVLACVAAFGRLPFVALELQAVAHVALAATCTYLFARRVLAERGAALVSAVVFAFGGYLAGYPPLQLAILETAAWLPLALLGADLVASTASLRQAGAARPALRRRRALGTVVLALAAGMAVLAGHPQSALLLAYSVAGYAAWRARPWRDADARVWLALVVAAVAALGLSAAAWWPALAFMRLSNRAAIDYAAVSHGFPPRELLGLLMPGLTHWSPLYGGVLPLLLAGVAAARALTSRSRRARRARFWVALGIGSLLLSLGGGGVLFDLLYLAAPGWNMFRGQERAAMTVAFSIAMLCGHGCVTWRSAPRTLARPLAASAAALVALSLVAGLTAATEVGAVAWRSALVAAGSAAVVLVARALGPSRRRALALVLTVIAVDLYLAAAGTNLTSQPPLELRVTPEIAMLRAEGARRVDNEDRLPRNFGVIHSVEATYGASPLRLQTFDRLHDALASRAEERLWALLAVSHVLTWRTQLAGAEVSISVGEGDDRNVLHRLESPRPHVWRATAAERVSDEEAIARLVDPAFGAMNTVLLHDVGARARYRAGGIVGEGPRAPGAASASTTGDAPAWLVFSEIYHPDWKATVDGRPAPVLRADVALIAVPVPAGTHDVRLVFTAPAVQRGLLLSLLSALVLAAVVVRLSLPRR